MSQRLLRTAGLFGIALLLGCGRPDTVEVSGKVTWNGAPVPHGDILLVADDPQIAAVAGQIEEGAYTLRSKPGKKRVEISSYRLSDKKTPQGRPIGERYIPDRYNAKSELTVDVTLDGDNKFDFALKP
jgi:hypothetical protein